MWGATCNFGFGGASVSEPKHFIQIHWNSRESLCKTGDLNNRKMVLNGFLCHIYAFRKLLVLSFEEIQRMIPKVPVRKLPHSKSGF